MEEISANYIVGLTDGEGSFTAYVKNPDASKEVKRRTKVEPRFYLKLIEKDKKILYDLKKFFGCGNVYFQKDKRANHQDCYRYEVANRKDLQKIIIPFFRSNSLRLRSKSRDFEIFCQIMEMVINNDHLKNSGLRKIYNLKQKMH
ncbi:MAG: LAGLIDADG homing endonuclease [Parcubacteria group bacterium GW2011_GWA2_53_21]|nr:MAG: LAGLIDADG homing endonuclease [Parcubacteria group bacterium GW2011_GWA2_53_21]